MYASFKNDAGWFKEIENKGASLLIITPKKQENIQKTILKTSITISIIYDENYKIMQQFDVAFIPSKGLKFMYNTMLCTDLKNAQSDDSQTLPVHATFIINTDGKVIWSSKDISNIIRKSNRYDR